MPIVAFLLALISMHLTIMIVGIITIPLHAIERRIQWRGKSWDYWKQQGVESPGERVKSISFVFGMLYSTVEMFCAIVGAVFVFQLLKSNMPDFFLIVASILFISYDLVRTYRFLGNSGIWSQSGHLIGNIVGLMSGILFIKSVVAMKV